MNSTMTSAGWYPDPSRAHELRYYDGQGWTDYVSDRGQGTEDPLGPVPAGMINWFPPHVMVASATTPSWMVEVPRVKMWILAILSAFVFWLRTPNLTIVVPLGVVFAIWCWRMTSPILAAHVKASSAAVTEIKAARWTSLGLAVLCVAQVALWTR